LAGWGRSSGLGVTDYAGGGGFFGGLSALISGAGTSIWKRGEK
jgi:hypothetical protein